MYVTPLASLYSVLIWTGLWNTAVLKEVLSKYDILVIRGLCSASCITQFGRQRPSGKPSFQSDLYRPWHCASASCRNCSKPCDSETSNLTTCRNSCDTAECLESCGEVYGQIERFKLTNTFPESSLQLKLSPPELVCMETQNGLGNVTLRWMVKGKDGHTSNDSLIFLVSMRPLAGQWSALGQTFSAVVPVTYLTPGGSYRFRITAMAMDGVVDVPTNSKEIIMLQDGQIGDQPHNLHVLDAYLGDHGVTVIIGWDSGTRPACRLLAHCLPLTCGGESVQQFLEGVPDNKWKIDHLKYDCKYKVLIYPEHTALGDQNSLNITTPSCLQLTHNNYSWCAPLAPENLKYEVFSKNQTTADLVITWSAPMHVTSDNAIDSYLVTWRKIPKLVVHAIGKPHQGAIEVSGNTSRVYLRSLYRESKYSVAVQARSRGGLGHKAVVLIHLQGVVVNRKSEEENAYFAFIAIPVSCLLAVGLVCLLVCRRRRQIQRSHLNLNKAKCGAFLTTINPFYKASARNERDETSRLMIDDYEVNWAWFNEGPCLGEGAFGKVLRADLRDGYILNKAHPSTRVFAVKVLRDFPTEEERRNLLYEIEFMKELGQHRNIVSIAGCCTVGSDIRLVMDYCPLGDLRHYLRLCREECLSISGKRERSTKTGNASSSSSQSSDSGISRHYPSCPTSLSSNTSDSMDTKPEFSGISEQQLLSFARQITMGMEYISKQRFVHRDLAARNILVCADKTIKISDFGLTRDVYENNVYKFNPQRKIPYKWMPIETLFEQVFTTKSDVWSFAVVLWEIVTLGGFPYPGIQDKDLLRLLKDGYRMEKPNNCSQELYQIMLACWHSCPADRPSFSDLRLKLEVMLEVKMPYIDLRVHLNDDYFLEDAESSGANDRPSNNSDAADAGISSPRPCSLVSAESFTNLSTEISGQVVCQKYH